MHLPDRQSTTIAPPVALRPSSVTVGNAGHPHAAYWPMQIRSSSANRACSALANPMARVAPQQSVWWMPKAQSPAVVQVLSNAGKLTSVVVHLIAALLPLVPSPGGDASQSLHAEAVSERQPSGSRAQMAKMAATSVSMQLLSAPARPGPDTDQPSRPARHEAAAMTRAGSCRTPGVASARAHPRPRPR